MTTTPTTTTPSGGESISALLDRAKTDPAGAFEEAKQRFVGVEGVERVELLRVMGNASRELRRIDDSAAHLRAALDGAIALGDRRLEGLVAMSLAATLSYAGDFDESLRLAGISVDVLEGADRVLALGQRAGLLARSGRNDEALQEFTVALAAAGDDEAAVVNGELWMNRGVLHGWAGNIDAAEHDTRRALATFERLGQTKRAADVRHNLAWLAGRRGDLVEAFRRFDDTEREYEQLGLTGAAIFPDRSEALLAAGLAREALALAERAVEDLGAAGDDVDVAEASMLVARAALLAGDPERAAVAGADATRRFEGQGRSGWWAAAASLQVEARMRAGLADAADVSRIEEVIEAAERSGLAAGAEARVVAAELAADRKEWHDVERHLAALAVADADANLGLALASRRSVVQVRLRAARGDVDDALAEGVRAVDEFGALTAGLGGTELRAHIALHVTELVELGLALALRGAEPREAFAWSERQRAAALDAAPVRPPEDRELATRLDRLRSVLTELDAKARAGSDDATLARERANLQDQVRRRSRHVVGVAAPALPGDALEDVTAAGLAAWVSFVEVGGQLGALRVTGGRPEYVALGGSAAAHREADLLRSTLAMHLNALGRGRARDAAVVEASAEEADAVLLAPLALPPGPVAISPIGGLHDLPWGLLPSLRERSFTLAPSLALWRRCWSTLIRPPQHVVAAAGPDVPLADVEAREVLACYGSGTSITGPAATVAGVTAAMRGADVAHLVCHGRFSSENTMFSSLLLADGPMFVYDLERLAPAPGTVVLSACHAGSHATPAGREVLGLTASLLARGPRSVVAATVPIPDTLSTVELMAELHRALAAGRSAADGLVDLRRRDPVVGGAFACYGAG